MLGNKFGKLLVLEEVSSDVKNHRKYLCECDCGEHCIVIANNLKKGNSTQCKRCSTIARKEKTTTVNSSLDKKTYKVYRSMINRCITDHNYFSRGISVCNRWLEEIDGFRNFLEDMGPSPEGMSIDRIDNDKGYYKENCRWTSSSVQNHNKRKRKDAKTSEYIGVSYFEKHAKWAMQIMFEGSRITKMFEDELSAAIYYDNLSEKYYNDRPNKTEPKEVTPYQNKVGGVSFDKKTSKFRVRITVDGKRKSLGAYDTEEEAEEVLKKYKCNS